MTCWTLFSYDLGEYEATLATSRNSMNNHRKYNEMKCRNGDILDIILSRFQTHQIKSIPKYPKYIQALDLLAPKNP